MKTNCSLALFTYIIKYLYEENLFASWLFRARTSLLPLIKSHAQLWAMVVYASNLSYSGIRSRRFLSLRPA
jgi:hypothetical protein